MSPSQYSLLRAKMLRIWAAILVLALIAGIASSVIQVASNRDANQKITAANHRAEFWRIIAGQQGITTSNADQQLASDLHELLGSTDPQARQLPNRVLTFQGDANSYGGLKDHLDISPFTNDYCTGCGRLRPTFETKLLLIKQGKVNQLIASERPPDAHGFSINLLGVPSPLWLVIVWILGGPIILIAADRSIQRNYRRMALRPLGQLDWDMDGTCDGTKRQIMAMAPTYFVVAVPRQRRRQATAYGPKALARKREVDDQLKRLRERYVQINDDETQELFKGVCRKADALLDRFEEVSPNRLLSTSNSMGDYLGQLTKIIDRYVRIQHDSEQSTQDRSRRLLLAHDSMVDFDGILRRTINTIDSAEDVDLEVACVMLRSARL